MAKEGDCDSMSFCSSFSTENDHEESRSPSPFLSSDSHPAANFPPRPIAKSFSYNTLNAGAPSFLPRTNSSSNLHVTKKAKRPPPISLAGTNAIQKSNFFNRPPSSGPPSPIILAGPPSPITLAGTTTTQQTSFVIPQVRGPPTLLHVFTSTSSLPSPTSPGGPHVFASGNFGAAGYHQDIMATVAALSPRPMSPAVVAALYMPPQVESAKEAGGAAAMGGHKSRILDEVSRKVLHQVEYYFSDLNLATTDHLMRYINKDPEGYVPLSAVSSFKKIRTSTSSNAQLANILRNSEKLIVSSDGERVKRVNHLTESYMEELKSRIVIAENLPGDHCHQNLMRIFSAVGSVKAIRTCQPSASNGMASSASRTAKSEGLPPSNKLHAFVEYESVELAEKAVVELTDSKNWSGLKVRFLVRSQVKSSPPRSLKSDTDSICGGFSTEDSECDEDGEQKKPLGRGWGKGRGRSQYQPPKKEQHSAIKQIIVPRMPDGTRGFSMGRGKMIAARTA